MSATEISNWLAEGLAAAKSGDRVFARQQLQRVIEADDHNLQAWLALSEVAATLEDKEVCLENVLALDPDNSPVREQLNLVRSQIAGAPKEVEESYSPESLAPAVQPVLDQDKFDDPLLCVYCGHLTGEADMRCPNCKRDVYQSFYKHEHSHWIVVGWIINIIDVLYTGAVLIVLTFFMSAALSTAQLGSGDNFGQLLAFYFNQPTTLSAQAQTAILTSLPRSALYFRLGYMLFMLIVGFGLLTRRRGFHLLFIGSVAVATAAAFLAYRFSNAISSAGDTSTATPFQRILSVAIFEASNVTVALIGAMAVLLLLGRFALVFLMENDFTRITERLWSQIDRSVKNAHTAFIRAKSYMQRNMWTLSAMYLQQAIAMDSTNSDYYLGLAESYAHLKRYPRALAMLDQADRLQSGLSATPHLRGAILKLQDQAAQAAGEVDKAQSAVKGNLPA